MKLIPDDVWYKYCNINYIKAPAYVEPKKFFKISVVTTCMDRLEDLM